MTHKEIVEKFGEGTLAIFYNLVKEKYGSFDESLMEKDDEGFPIPDETVSEFLNDLNQKLQKFHKLTSVTITKDVKDEIAQIIFDKTHRTIDWWELENDFVIVWDNKGYCGVVFKSEDVAKIKNLQPLKPLKNKFNLKNGYVFYY